jgi:hypothetical protein
MTAGSGKVYGIENLYNTPAGKRHRSVYGCCRFFPGMLKELQTGCFYSVITCYCMQKLTNQVNRQRGN